MPEQLPNPNHNLNGNDTYFNVAVESLKDFAWDKVLENYRIEEQLAMLNEDTLVLNTVIQVTTSDNEVEFWQIEVQRLDVGGASVDVYVKYKRLSQKTRGKSLLGQWEFNINPANEIIGTRTNPGGFDFVGKQITRHSVPASLREYLSSGTVLPNRKAARIVKIHQQYTNELPEG